MIAIRWSRNIRLKSEKFSGSEPKSQMQPGGPPSPGRVTLRRHPCPKIDHLYTILSWFHHVILSNIRNTTHLIYFSSQEIPNGSYRLTHSDQNICGGLPDKKYASKRLAVWFALATCIRWNSLIENFCNQGITEVFFNSSKFPDFYFDLNSRSKRKALDRN